MNSNNEKKKIDTKVIARSAVFAAISIILYVVPFLKFPLPIFPSFLEIHFDEVPALIAGFAYGPISAIFILLIKTIVKLPFTTSMCLGETIDFLYGIIFIVPASLIYKKIHKFKGALIGLIVGTILQVILSSLLTTFVMLDFYCFIFGFTKENILEMCQAINPNISSLTWPFILFVALPFNALKDVLVSLITILLYKKLHTLIDKIGKDK